jgi:hypothetical protein
MPGFGFSCVNLRIYGLFFKGIRGCPGMFSQGDASRLSCFVMQDLHRRLGGGIGSRVPRIYRTSLRNKLLLLGDNEVQPHAVIMA